MSQPPSHCRHLGWNLTKCTLKPWGHTGAVAPRGWGWKSEPWQGLTWSLPCPRHTLFQLGLCASRSNHIISCVRHSLPKCSSPSQLSLPLAARTDSEHQPFQRWLWLLATSTPEPAQQPPQRGRAMLIPQAAGRPAAQYLVHQNL